MLFLCAAAVAATFLYTRTAKLSLGLHASFYLAAAAAVSPLPGYAWNAMAGIVPSAPDWRLSLVALSALAAATSSDLITLRINPSVACSGSFPQYWQVSPQRPSWSLWQSPQQSPAALDLDASRLSVIRTIVNCALALALGFVGSRWHRIELGWVAYAAVAVGTLKLLFEDLRFGNAASMVVSLLFYGLVLICSHVLPGSPKGRMLRASESAIRQNLAGLSVFLRSPASPTAIAGIPRQTFDTILHLSCLIW